MKINPRKLRGRRREGYALDVQTTSATFLGYNAFGHPEFDTTRSPLGELVYQLKYRGNRTGVPEIVDTVSGFLRDWKIKVDALAPVLLNLCLFARRDDFLMPLAAADSVHERWFVRW